jgi:hypothetical protein
MVLVIGHHHGHTVMQAANCAVGGGLKALQGPRAIIRAKKKGGGGGFIEPLPPQTTL